MHRASNPKPSVYYDGACPLCAREIGFYRKRRGAEAVEWVDVSALPDGAVAPGLAKDAALARFHVRTGQGRLLSGGAAFAHLWSALPGFRALGAIFGRPPMSWFADRGYDLFLKVRPVLQSALTRQAKSGRRF